MSSGSERRRSEGAPADQNDELPRKSSPYVNYENLEDYKQKAYGTQGHQEVVDRQPGGGGGGGGTEGPTLSGSGLSERQFRAMEALKGNIIK